MELINEEKLPHISQLLSLVFETFLINHLCHSTDNFSIPKPDLHPSAVVLDLSHTSIRAVMQLQIEFTLPFHQRPAILCVRRRLLL